MKKNLLLTLIALNLLNFCFAQNPLVKQWDKRFGGDSSDYLYTMQQTIDSGFILGGVSYSGISGDKTQPCWGNNDYWIVKTDSLGIKQWDKRFGGTGYDDLYSLQQTSDGGFILGGETTSGISGDKSQPSWGSFDYWVVKTDSFGIKQWDKRFGTAGADIFYSLLQTNDKGYILGGYSYSDSSGDKSQNSWHDTLNNPTNDYWIIKIDSFGNKQWDKRFGGTAEDKLLSLQQTIDGGYILGGFSYSGISGDKTQPNWDTTCIFSCEPGCTPDYWIVKIDSLGNKQWDKRFGGIGYDFLLSLQQTDDGGYILGGLSNSGSNGDKTQPNWDTSSFCPSTDYWVVKTDSIGNKQWDKRYGGTYGEDDFGSIVQTPDGGYFLAGCSYSGIGGNKTENNLGMEQAWIVKTDQQGNLQWDKTVFTTGHDEWARAVLTNNKCYTIANMTTGGIGGYKTEANWDTTNMTYDYWIIKFCDTTVTTNVEEIINTNSIIIYPNPTNTTLNLFLNNKKNLVVTNLIGEIVLQKNFSSNTNGKVELDVSFLSSGIYFIKAGSEVRKFVKE